MTLHEIMNILKNREVDILNTITASAIKEGRKIACDDTVKGHSNIDDLRKALEK